MKLNDGTAMSGKKILQYAALIAVIVAAYPFVKAGGVLDSWLGPWWWQVTIPLAAVVVLSAEAYRRYRVRTR